MATTAGGLPYPVGTDLVRDGDNAIRSLAEGVDGKKSVSEATRPMGSLGNMGAFVAGRVVRANIGYTTVTTDASGLFAHVPPAGAVCIVGVQFQCIVNDAADQMVFLVPRLEQSSSLTSLRVQARKLTDGSASPSTRVCYTFVIYYQGAW